MCGYALVEVVELCLVDLEDFSCTWRSRVASRYCHIAVTTIVASVVTFVDWYSSRINRWLTLRIAARVQSIVSKALKDLSITNWSLWIDRLVSPYGIRSILDDRCIYGGGSVQSVCWVHLVGLHDHCLTRISVSDSKRIHCCTACS